MAKSQPLPSRLERLCTKPLDLAVVHVSTTSPGCLFICKIHVHPCRKKKLLLTPVHKYHVQSLSGKLLTMIALVCDYERSNLFWVTENSSCKVEHVPVDFCLALSATHSQLYRCHKKHVLPLARLLHPSLSVLVKCHGLAYIYSAL